jgi:fucokinase
MFLLYTGRTRLARNLLQRVLRQWTVRRSGVTAAVEGLRNGAAAMAAALSAGDLERAGAELSAYWELKKFMAPNAEPAEVSAMLQVMRPYIYGASLCGAGGGGFLVGFTRAPGQEGAAALRAALRHDALTAGLKWSLHSCTVDPEGLVLSLQAGL